MTCAKSFLPRPIALMRAARNRETDCVLVWKFDRFARSTPHLLATLEESNHLGQRFASAQDQIDTDSPMGRALFVIIGAMAELGRATIRPSGVMDCFAFGDAHLRSGGDARGVYRFPFRTMRIAIGAMRAHYGSLWRRVSWLGRMPGEN
jgi:hypothetical protein